MTPYDENAEVETIHDPEYPGEDYMGNPKGFWDWYQIGGRWTGVFSDYEPSEDPANQEVCFLCLGTGTRTDGMFGPGGCNGCAGEGQATKWPTQWAPHDSDISRLGDIRAALAERSPFYVVGPELFARREIYNPVGRWPDRDAGETHDDIPNEERVFIQTTEVEDLLAELSDDVTIVVVDIHS